MTMELKWFSQRLVLDKKLLNVAKTLDHSYKLTFLVTKLKTFIPCINYEAAVSFSASITSLQTSLENIFLEKITFCELLDN